MVRLSDFELRLVKPSGEAFPEVVHNGKEYAVAAPGQPYEVEVTQFTTAGDVYRRPSYVRQVSLQVDGSCVGYRQTLENRNSVRFTGFLKAGDAHSITKQGFVFAKPEESEEKGQRVTNLDFQEGKILAEVHVIEFTGATAAVPTRIGSMTSAASVAKLPEGKKFFLAPSLTTGQGKVHVDRGFDQRHWRDALCGIAEAVLELRYETAATLLLRGVLKEDNPQHAAILQAAAGEMEQQEQHGQNGRDAGVSSRAATAVAAVTAAAAAAAEGAVAVSAGRHCKRQRQQQELIDLTQAVNEGDEVLAAKRQNQVLQCDLTGEEEGQGPAWRAVKKEVVDV